MPLNFHGPRMNRFVTEKTLSHSLFELHCLFSDFKNQISKKFLS